MEYVSVHDVEVPSLGLGTYKLQGGECTRVVEEALRMGYRHVDTAEMYGNQAAIGEALETSPVDREDVFLTTKIWRTELQYERAHASVRDSLDALGVDYVDLLLIHWPSEDVPVEETIRAMNELQAEGDVRHVGVSNFSVEQCREAMDASATPILTNQVEYHPFEERGDLLEFCIEEDVMLTAYSPLAKGRVVENGTLAEIGERYDKSAAQVALRWLLQQENVAAIPKASTRAHLEANFDVFDFSLSDEEMREVFDLGGGLADRVRDALGL